jgi:hypothetical protein
LSERRDGTLPVKVVRELVEHIPATVRMSRGVVEVTLWRAKGGKLAVCIRELGSLDTQEGTSVDSTSAKPVDR